MNVEYHAFGTINRTVSAGAVRRVILSPLWGKDPQLALPWSWCCLCGKEVYAQGEVLCEECWMKATEFDFLGGLLYGLEEGSGT